MTVDTGTAILIGGTIGTSLATVGWIFGQRQARKLNRLQHTFNVLESYRNDDAHWAAFDRFVVMVKAKTVPQLDDTNRKDDVAIIRRLLFHYEYVAAGIFCGGLDEMMIKLCEEGNMIELYKHTVPFVKWLKDEHKKEGFYENLQGIGKRWDGPSPPHCQRLFEAILLRPWRRAYVTRRFS